jgi:hypothetical protein
LESVKERDTQFPEISSSSSSSRLVTVEPVLIMFCTVQSGCKPQLPQLLHVMNEDIPDCQLELHEQFLSMCNENESLLDLNVWSDEAINKHNCRY